MEGGEVPDARPDFNEIRKNAAKDGIPISEIAIIYRGLNDEEIRAMEVEGLAAYVMGDRVIGRFSKDGTVMFPEKSVGVIHLAS